MKTILFAIIGLSAGAAITIQSSLSGQLSKRLSSPLLASSSVYLVGLIAIGLYLVTSKYELPSRDSIAQTPTYLWIAGGIISAISLTAVYWVMPQTGVSTTLLYVISGQLLASAVISHFALFELPASPLTTQRMLALALVFGGALLFTSN